MGKKNFTGVRTEVRRGKRVLVLDFPYTDKDGFRRRFRRNATVQLRGAAITEAARLMKRAAEFGIVEEEPAAKIPSCATYRAFVEGDFETLYMPTYRPATARRYRELQAQRVLAFFGEVPLKDIGPNSYRAFAAVLHRDGVQTKGPLTLVRTVMRAALACGLIDVLPAFPSGLVVTSRKLPDAPSSEEVDVMLSAPGWLGLAIALAALAGLRMGEVRALEVRDVDFEDHRILVRRALSENASLTPKSGHERAVPLAAGLEVRLKAVVKSKFPRGRVVVDDDGQTPRRQQVLHQFKRFLRKCGLKERSFHSLRHYFVSQLLKGGSERGGRAGAGGTLQAGDDPALRPRCCGGPARRHRQARQVAPGARQLGGNGTLRPSFWAVFLDES